MDDLLRDHPALDYPSMRNLPELDRTRGLANMGRFVGDRVFLSAQADVYGNALTALDSSLDDYADRIDAYATNSNRANLQSMETSRNRALSRTRDMYDAYLAIARHYRAAQTPEGRLRYDDIREDEQTRMENGRPMRTTREDHITTISRQIARSENEVRAFRSDFETLRPNMEQIHQNVRAQLTYGSTEPFRPRLGLLIEEPQFAGGRNSLYRPPSMLSNPNANSPIPSSSQLPLPPAHVHSTSRPPVYAQEHPRPRFPMLGTLPELEAYERHLRHHGPPGHHGVPPRGRGRGRGTGS